MVLHTQVSVVSKPESNWGGVEMGTTSEESGGGKEAETNAAVHGGQLEMVREPG